MDARPTMLCDDPDNYPKRGPLSTTPAPDDNESREVPSRKRGTSNRPETGDLKGTRRSSDASAPLATKSVPIPSRAASVNTRPDVNATSSPPLPSPLKSSDPASSNNQVSLNTQHQPAPTPAARATSQAVAPASTNAPVPSTAPQEPEENEEDGDEEEEVLEEDVEPVRVGTDTGFAWVILFASFVCNFLVDGIGFSFGVFMDDVQKEFDAPTHVVALAGSLCVGVYLLVGTNRTRLR